MTTERETMNRNRRGQRLSVRIVLFALGLLVLLGGVGTALATWSASGSGTGTASVGTLSAPASVAISGAYSTVTVNWTAATPPTGTLSGYVVLRHQGATTTNACGTNLATATYIPAGTTNCSDPSVPNGSYTYTVVVVWRSWTAESPSSNVISVNGDPTFPSQTVTMTTPTNAYLGGATVYYRGDVAGSFKLAATVSDSDSGPASANFPAIATTGWTHNNETVTTGTGTNPKTYTSSNFSWTANPSSPSPITITGKDVGGNSVSTGLIFASDTTGPTGGALTVNGVAASGAGSSSIARANFTIGVRTDFNADAGSGLLSSVLTRETASLTNGVCGTFGSSTTITGNPAQTGTTGTCYRFNLTGTDRVGNTSVLTTIVRYDTTAPTQVLSLSSASGAYYNGTTIYVKRNAAGSFVLNSAVTDTYVGPASVAFPAITTTGWTHPAQTVNTGTGSNPTITYSSSTYSWVSGARRPTNTAIVATDLAGNTLTTTPTFTTDNTAPTGGALTVNGTASSTAGTTSNNITGSYTIVRTDYTDAASGIASSVLTVEQASLTNNTCGTYGSPSTITGAPAQSGIATGCYRYRLTGTDRVGNTVTRSTVVKVDRSAPIGGALTVNGTAATAGGTTSYSNAASVPINVRTDFTDAESGLASSTLVRTQATVTNGVCGAFGTPTTLTGNPTQTLTAGCWRFALTGTDNAGNAAPLITTVIWDNTAPTGGALTVNGTAATAGGSNSITTATSFTIGTRTDYTDAGAGIASSTLTRTFATLTGTTCGTFGAPTTITGNPAQSGLAPGCYQYTLTGTDNVGNAASIATTVQQRLVVSNVALINGTGTAGRIDAGDRIEITFSDTLAVNTVCSAWSGNGSNQTLNANNDVGVVLTNGGVGNDTITFTSTSCTLNIGSINLSSTAYTTANVTFKGTGAGVSTVAWNVATKKLTITLGTASGAGAATVGATTPIFTPNAAIQNTNGVLVGGTYTLPSAVQS